MEHGTLSQRYRHVARGRQYYTAMHSVAMAAMETYSADAVLRNGKRILRACATMKKQLEAAATHE